MGGGSLTLAALTIRAGAFLPQSLQRTLQAQFASKPHWQPHSGVFGPQLMSSPSPICHRLRRIAQNSSATAKCFFETAYEEMA